MAGKTTVTEFKGHHGVAAAAMMSDGTNVIILCNSLEDLSKAFEKVVRQGSAPLDPDRCKQAILISPKALQP